MSGWQERRRCAVREDLSRAGHVSSSRVRRQVDCRLPPWTDERKPSGSGNARQLHARDRLCQFHWTAESPAEAFSRNVDYVLCGGCTCLSSLINGGIRKSFGMPGRRTWQWRTDCLGRCRSAGHKKFRRSFAATNVRKSSTYARDLAARCR